MFPKTGCDEKSEPDPLKRVIPFATSLPMDKMLWNVSGLPEDYRKRWGIERGYVEVERFRAMATSRNHTLRLFYFFYALILCNAWLLANLILAKTFSKFLTELIIRLVIVKAVTRSIIVDSFRGRADGQNRRAEVMQHNPIWSQSHGLATRNKALSKRIGPDCEWRAGACLTRARRERPSCEPSASALTSPRRWRRRPRRVVPA
jgi:hypothetical protein